MQKLSSQQPSMESRLKALKEISAEIGVTLHLEEDVGTAVKVWKLAYLKNLLITVSLLSNYFLCL